jgi:hypothetical protein
MSELPNIVLVHGAWADGSSWSAVIEALQADVDSRHFERPAALSQCAKAGTDPPSIWTRSAQGRARAPRHRP